MNWELQDIQLDLEKTGTRDQIANICWIIEKASEWKKNKKKQPSTFALLTTPKPLTVWITTNYGKFSKRWECQTTWPDSWEISTQVKKQVRTRHGTMDWFKLGKEYVKAVYCHPAYLTYLQSTSCEILGWKNRKLESKLSGKISITTDTHMTPPLGQKAKRNWRGSWRRWKRRVKKLA